MPDEFFARLEYLPWGVCLEALRRSRHFGLLEGNEAAHPRRRLGDGRRLSSWHAFALQLGVAALSTTVVVPVSLARDVDYSAKG